MNMIKTSGLAALALLCASALGSQACDITIGMVMELTGPAGAYGQAGAKSVEMAFRDLNEAGGVLGCNLVTDTRDSQSQGNVAVDQATQLVNIKQVPVVIGGIISSVSIPILTSVTAVCRRGAGFARILEPDADAAFSVTAKPAATSSGPSHPMRFRVSRPPSTRWIRA
jgi:hypothetical protein